VNLDGRFVVPPFADAHQHLFDPSSASAFVARQTRDGIFYIKEQSSAPFARRLADAALSAPGGVDLISANQGWTSTGGHPVEVIQRGAQMPGPAGQFVRDSLDPAIVMQVDSRADIDRRWTYFLAGKPRPDFVKVFLLYSEYHARLRADPKAFGNRGMDPSLVPYIVELAHAAGLRVSAHVYTAADFRNAIQAGVDDIAHLPGGKGDSSPFLLTEADAALAAQHKVTVATTVVQHGDSALTDRLIRDQYSHNIKLLRAHGVTLLIGSDMAEGTAATEIAALSRSGLFTDAELLRLWSVTTPQTIFPEKRIGRLADGYDASFLVLRDDPLANIANTRSIMGRVRRGVTLK
jgi:imidazolonepropionase-like amidohydrolase